MGIEEIKEFLRERPGYLKEGAGRLSRKLNANYDNCKKALREVRRELKAGNRKNAFASDARIKKLKRWQLPNGETRESVEFVADNEETPEDVINKIKEHFEEYKSPKAFKYDIKDNKENCAIINLFDAHIDKLCLVSEADEDSSLSTNIAKFENAFDELLAQCLIYKPEIIYLPVGSDFFNANDLNIHPSTKRGTPQRVMGGQEDSFKTGIKVYRNCIDKAAQHCNVICPVIKGNHDEDKVFYLGVALELAYENNERVFIDNERHQRKYYKYGQNLFGFAHGDKEKNKVAQLPLIMAEERKHDWADTKYREWYLGDIHHKQEYKFLRGQDFIGCMVRFLRSVGTSDKWHHDAGYVGVPKTAEAFIWTKDNGMKANFTTNI